MQDSHQLAGDKEGSSPPAEHPHSEPPAQQLSRRQFLTLSSATAGAAFLAACGGESPATPTAVPPAATRPAQLPTQQPITLPTPAAAAGATITVGPSPTPAVAQGKPGGVKIFRTARTNDIVFMDPARITESTDYTLGEAIFNYIGRYTYKPGGTTIDPELATWELQNDAKTYIFSLRKGVKYHGKYGEVTAEDIKWQWERMKDAKTASRYKADFDGSTIEVIDPYTLKVTFDRPYPSFIPASLGFRPGLIVSKQAFEEKGDAWKTLPIGSGAFEWEKWEPNVQVTLKRFEGYWGPKPKVDKIITRTKVDERTSVLAVSRGELDAFYISNTDVAIEVSKNTPPNTKFYRQEFGESPWWAAFNMKRKPLDDVRVRQALRYAIDNEAIARQLFGGLADPIASFLPPFMFGFNADVPRFQYDPDRAKSLLREANVPRDWAPSLLSTSDGIGRTFGEALESYWKDAGINVKLDLPERGDFERKRAAGEYDAFGIGVGRIEPDQIATPYWRSGSPVNNSFYAGADDLIDQAKSEPDQAKRAKLYHDLQRKISEDSPAAFIAAYSNHLLVNNRVSGIAGPSWQGRFDWFSIDVPAE